MGSKYADLLRSSRSIEEDSVERAKKAAELEKMTKSLEGKERSWRGRLAAL